MSDPFTIGSIYINASCFLKRVEYSTVASSFSLYFDKQLSYLRYLHFLFYNLLGWTKQIQLIIQFIRILYRQFQQEAEHYLRCNVAMMIAS